MPYAKMREAIAELKDDVLTTDQAESLQECMPTQEDTLKLKAYKGDPKELGEVRNGCGSSVLMLWYHLSLELMLAHRNLWCTPHSRPSNFC